MSNITINTRHLDKKLQESFEHIGTSDSYLTADNSKVVISKLRTKKEVQSLIKSGFPFLREKPKKIDEPKDD